jgi:hypothetical protein
VTLRTSLPRLLSYAAVTLALACAAGPAAATRLAVPREPVVLPAALTAGQTAPADRTLPLLIPAQRQTLVERPVDEPAPRTPATFRLFPNTGPPTTASLLYDQHPSPTTSPADLLCSSAPARQPYRARISFTA